MKALKGIVLVIGPIALIAGIIWFTTKGGGSPLPDSVTLVDITSGEIVTRERDRLPGVPARNEKGQYALFRVERNDSGNWQIIERDREMLDRTAAEQPELVTAVDLKTYEVQ